MTTFTVVITVEDRDIPVIEEVIVDAMMGEFDALYDMTYREATTQEAKAFHEEFGMEFS